MLRLTDLREILHYIPEFRDRVFVIAIDGAVVADDNFGNLLLDISLLRSLRIGVALVHGAGLQVRQLAAKEGLRISSSDGNGITDEPTLNLSITAATRVTHQILQGLADSDLRGASSNARCSPSCRHPGRRRSLVHGQSRADRYADAQIAARSRHYSRHSAAGLGWRRTHLSTQFRRRRRGSRTCARRP